MTFDEFMAAATEAGFTVYGMPGSVDCGWLLDHATRVSFEPIGSADQVGRVDYRETLAGAILERKRLAKLSKARRKV